MSPSKARGERTLPSASPGQALSVALTLVLDLARTSSDESAPSFASFAKEPALSLSKGANPDARSVAFDVVLDFALEFDFALLTKPQP